MPIEFHILNLRVQVTERLDEEQSEIIRKEQLLKIEESQLQSMWHLEQKQLKTKAFVDRHRKSKEKLFDIGKLVLVFQTKMGSMLEKLRFRWIGPFWIVNNYNVTYQIGTLAGEVLPKWVNGFKLNHTKDRHREIPFRQRSRTKILTVYNSTRSTTFLRLRRT